MKEKGKASRTPTGTGYKIKVVHGGIGAEDSFRPRTNDFAVEPLIDAAVDEVCRYGWTDKETAQRVLDDLAIEHGWPEWQDI